MTRSVKPGLLDRLTESFLYAFVWLGLTPSRWPWSSCGTVILQVRGRRSGQVHSTLVTWAEYGGSRYLVVMPAMAIPLEDVRRKLRVK